MGHITVFTTSTCPHCARAKALLNSHGLPFTEISLLKFPAKREAMTALAQRTSVPQIFFQNHPMGGADDLEKLIQDGLLASKYEEYVLNATDSLHEALVLPSTEPKHEEDEASWGPAPVVQVGGDCLPYWQLVHRLRTALKPIIHKRKRIFDGKALVSALLAQFTLRDETESAKVAQRLLEEGLIAHDHKRGMQHKFDLGLHYRFAVDSRPLVLNQLLRWSKLSKEQAGAARDQSPSDHVLQCRKQLNELLDRYMDNQGRVDYLAAVEDDQMAHFEASICALQDHDLTSMNDAVRMAYCINVYNMLVLHAFLRVGVPQTDLQRLSFFASVGYEIGGLILSMNDIENGILRGNRPPPYQLRRPFTRRDPRYQVARSAPEPRIHFALNCGAKSCPPVQVYTAEAIDAELDLAARAFLEHDANCCIDLEHQTLYLNRILGWYKGDFGGDPRAVASGLLEWLNGPKKTQLETLLRSRFRIRYHPYDWSTNASQSPTYTGGTKCAIM